MDTASRKLLDKRLAKTKTLSDRLEIFFKVIGLAFAALVTYWAVDGAWLVWSGYRHGWQNSGWKLGVIYLYIFPFPLLVAGTIRYKWKLGVLSDWPDRMLKSEQAELDELHRASSELRDETFTRGEILRIKRDYYRHMGILAFAFVFCIGLDVISWLIHFDSEQTWFHFVQTIFFYGAWSLQPLVNTRRKLNALDSKRYKLSELERAGSRTLKIAWYLCIILCAILCFTLAIMGLWLLGQGFVPGGQDYHTAIAREDLIVGFFFLVSGGILLAVTKSLYKNSP